MYNALGYGKGDTILACFAIAVGIPAYVHLPFSSSNSRSTSTYLTRIYLDQCFCGSMANGFGARPDMRSADDKTIRPATRSSPSITSHDHDAHDSRFNVCYHARHAIDNYSHTCIISGTLLIWHTIDLDRTMDGRPSTAQFGLAKSTSAPRPLRPTAISSVSGSPTPLCIPGVRDSGTGFTLGTSATYRRILLGISICHVVCYTLLVVLHGLLHALYLPPLQEILASSQSSEPGHPGCY